MFYIKTLKMSEQPSLAVGDLLEINIKNDSMPQWYNNCQVDFISTQSNAHTIFVSLTDADEPAQGVFKIYSNRTLAELIIYTEHIIKVLPVEDVFVLTDACRLKLDIQDIDLHYQGEPIAVESWDPLKVGNVIQSDDMSDLLTVKYIASDTRSIFMEDNKGMGFAVHSYESMRIRQFPTLKWE